MYAAARNAAGAIALVADVDWPPGGVTMRVLAVTMRVLDLDGREIHSAIKGDNLSYGANRSEARAPSSNALM
jgi:hypothetical protein